MNNETNGIKKANPFSENTLQWYISKEGVGYKNEGHKNHPQNKSEFFRYKKGEKDRKTNNQKTA